MQLDLNQTNITQSQTTWMEVCTIDLTLNLLLSHVILIHIATHSFESTNSSTVKLLHTNTQVSNFENSTQRFKSSTMLDLMQQLYSIAKFIVCTRSPTIASKGFAKTLDLGTKHCPLEYVKLCFMVCIYISLRSIKTLDLMAKKES